MKDFSHAVVIGRFQPFHNGHQAVIEKAGEIAHNVIVLVGSAHSAPSIKNPFPFDTRKSMIGASVLLRREQRSDISLTILPLRDYYYSDHVWVSNVQSLVTTAGIVEGDSIALIGKYKDESSYYLKMFPQWEFVPAPDSSGVSGTEIRTTLFDVNKGLPRQGKASELVKRNRVLTDWEGHAVIDPDVIVRQDEFFAKHLPPPVQHVLREFRKTTEYARLLDEWEHVCSYQESWAGSPFPPVFVTADAVVTCGGHVLVIKRGFNPGKGLFALPGGFIRQNERIQAAAIRELKEETRIRVDKIILESSIVGSQVFDYPHRSLRGRTITHAFHFRLKDGRLPEVAHGDDAAGAGWMPLMDVSRCEDQFFEDHAHIINAFVNRG